MTAAVISTVLCAVRFGWLMPCWAYRFRVVLGCAVGVAAGLSVNHVRHGSIQGTLLILTIGFMSLVLASLGQGAEIRDVARQIYAHPEAEDQPQVSMKFGIKVTVIVVVAAVVWEVVNPQFH